MEKFNTVNLKGKEYVMVNDRILAFKKLYPSWAIVTELVKLSEGICVIKATILNEDGEPMATGHAYEKEGSSFINKTSYIENCETSAKEAINAYKLQIKVLEDQISREWHSQ